MAERKPFLLRIDPALWQELEAWAADELRSVNSQIEYLLKQAVNRRKGVRNQVTTEMKATSTDEASSDA